ncbi:MAG: hypothetical protein ACYC2S_09825 [Spirochaetales bacterium]
MLIGARQKKKEDLRADEELAMQKRQNLFGNITGAVSGIAGLAKTGFDVYDTLKLKPQNAATAFEREKEMAGITQENALETAAKEHEYRSLEAGDERVWASEEKKLDRVQEWGLKSFQEGRLDNRLQAQFVQDLTMMRAKGVVDLEYLKEKYGYDDKLQASQITATSTENSLDRTLTSTEGAADRLAASTEGNANRATTVSENALDRTQQANLQTSQNTFTKGENALDRTNAIDVSKIGSAGNVTEINAQARNAKLSSLLGVYPSAEKSANQAFMDMFTLWETSNPGKNPTKDDLRAIGLKAAERLGVTASSYSAEFPEIERIVSAAAKMLQGDYTLPVVNAPAKSAVPPTPQNLSVPEPAPAGTGTGGATNNVGISRTAGQFVPEVGAGAKAIVSTPAPPPSPDAEGWLKDSSGRLYRDEGRQKIYMDALGKPDAQGYFTDSTGKKFKYTKSGKVYK